MRRGIRIAIAMVRHHALIRIVIEQRRRDELQSGFVLREINGLPAPSPLAIIERGEDGD